jgi:hypothetical protein
MARITIYPGTINRSFGALKYFLSFLWTRFQNQIVYLYPGTRSQSASLTDAQNRVEASAPRPRCFKYRPWKFARGKSWTLLRIRRPQAQVGEYTKSVQLQYLCNQREFSLFLTPPPLSANYQEVLESGALGQRDDGSTRWDIWGAEEIFGDSHSVKTWAAVQVTATCFSHFKETKGG